LGLSTDDSPLNTMVGSDRNSLGLGLYTDGHLLIESHWYKSTCNCKITAGTTVGFLVYLNDNINNDSNDGNINNNGGFIGNLFGFCNSENNENSNNSEDNNSNNNNNNINKELIKENDDSHSFQFNINNNGISQEFSNVVTRRYTCMV
jgi:hypothetical protein